jgi:hypothetical protein
VPDEWHGLVLVGDSNKELRSPENSAVRTRGLAHQNSQRRAGGCDLYAELYAAATEYQRFYNKYLENIEDGLAVTNRLVNALPVDPMVNRNLRWLIVAAC